MYGLQIAFYEVSSLGFKKPILSCVMGEIWLVEHDSTKNKVKHK